MVDRDLDRFFAVLTRRTKPDDDLDFTIKAVRFWWDFESFGHAFQVAVGIHPHIIALEEHQ